MEGVHTPQGDKCDGSVIEKTSLCCLGDAYVACPSGSNCENFAGDLNLDEIYSTFMLQMQFANMNFYASNQMILWFLVI